MMMMLSVVIQWRQGPRKGLAWMAKTGRRDPWTSLRMCDAFDEEFQR